MLYNVKQYFKNQSTIYNYNTFEFSGISIKQNNKVNKKYKSTIYRFEVHIKEESIGSLPPMYSFKTLEKKGKGMVVIRNEYGCIYHFVPKNNGNFAAEGISLSSDIGSKYSFNKDADSESLIIKILSTNQIIVLTQKE